MKKGTLVTTVLEKVAKQLGVEMHIEPRWGYVGQICLPDGRKRYFRNTNLDLNVLGASEIARDKAYADFFLRRMGYPVITGRAFCTRRWVKAIGCRLGPDAAFRYAQRLGFPVIVKPNSKSQGVGVFKVANKREFYRAVKAIEGNERMFLVQRIVTGHDYRIVVLDGKVISVYERLPLTVTGDGRTTVKGLLERKQRQFKAIGRDTKIKINDPRIVTELKRRGMRLASRPSAGQVIALLPNANLSTGGDAIDITDHVHPDWRRFAKRLARDMNLRFIGIDVMSKRTLDEKPGSFVVIEVNAAPGLDNYATMGKKQERIVEDLYRKVLQSLLK